MIKKILIISFMFILFSCSETIIENESNNSLYNIEVFLENENEINSSSGFTSSNGITIDENINHLTDSEQKIDKKLETEYMKEVFELLKNNKDILSFNCSNLNFNDDEINGTVQNFCELYKKQKRESIDFNNNMIIYKQNLDKIKALDFSLCNIDKNKYIKEEDKKYYEKDLLDCKIAIILKSGSSCDELHNNSDELLCNNIQKTYKEIDNFENKKKVYIKYNSIIEEYVPSDFYSN